jgi:hypothetical protein
MKNPPQSDPTAAGYFVASICPLSFNTDRPETKKPRIPAGLEQAMRPAPVAFKSGTA